MFDDDFDFFTGGFGDMNGDGGIDFDEFMNQEYEYQQFAESHSKVGNFIFNNNDDWEIDNIDTAAEYSLNPYDYADKEEFCDTLFSAKSEAESYEVNFDYEEPAVCAAVILNVGYYAVLYGYIDASGTNTLCIICECHNFLL